MVLHVVVGRYLRYFSNFAGKYLCDIIPAELVFVVVSSDGNKIFSHLL